MMQASVFKIAKPLVLKLIIGSVVASEPAPLLLRWFLARLCSNAAD